MTKASRVHVFALLLGALFVLLMGCAPVYVPNAVHTPMLEERGDVRVGGGVGAFGGTTGLDLQAAYAISDAVGVSANVSYGEEAESEESSSDFHRHQFGEMGVGYFNDISSFAQFEIYGGYGLGQAEAIDTYTFFNSQTIRATGRYDRFFVQPAIELSAGPVHLSGATRLVRVNFHEFESSRDFRTVSDIEPVFFNEMALGLGVGAGAFRVGVQGGVSAPLSDPEEIDFDTQSLWVSLGAEFRFSARE